MKEELSQMKHKTDKLKKRTKKIRVNDLMRRMD